MDFFTIGVYHSTEKEFFDKLTANGIDTFCDIRQRRAVRGAQYAFVNSNKLQKKLTELGINYDHILNLAAPDEIRELQKRNDLKKGVAQRDRQMLDEEFKAGYKNSVLDKFDFSSFIQNLENSGSKKVVLFCVEEKPEACHRSMVAQKLQDQYSYKVTHL
jgi:uncharacterized protein (DUF488 family)